MSALVFDLDGTLSDPLDGVARSIEHACRALESPVPDRDSLRGMIGPPLRETFRTLLATADDARVERAVALYRERYASGGWQENALYPGIVEALGQLERRGHRLFVATSKAQPFAERILAHFALASRFAAIRGAGLDASRDDKADLLADLIAGYGLDPADTLMIGDREHDVRAATRCRVRTIGVVWGFGSEHELEAAGAVALCARPDALPALVETVLAAGRFSRIEGESDSIGGRPT